MAVVSVTEFSTSCLQWIDRVASSGEPICITRDGRPIARLVAVEPQAERQTLFGYMAGTMEVVGDIVSVPAPAWLADSDEGDPLLADLGPPPICENPRAA